jgi:regulator of protease activity HflC (stomatin/prohibitin superfamily)
MEEIRSRIIDPTIQEVMKASTAKYTAEELITKREAVSFDTITELQERLGNM